MFWALILPEGVDQRSPLRHPDFLGADDLAVKIWDLRGLSFRAPAFTGGKMAGIGQAFEW